VVDIDDLFTTGLLGRQLRGYVDSAVSCLAKPNKVLNIRLIGMLCQSLMARFRCCILRGTIQMILQG